MALQFLFLEKQIRHNSRHVMLWKMEPTSAINNIYKYRGKNQLSSLIRQIMSGLICNYQSKYSELTNIKRIYYLSNTIWILENYNIGIWVSKLRQQSDNFDFFVCFPVDNIYSMTLTSFKPFLLRIVTYGLEEKIS